jgi:hypothetical protein
LTTNSELPPLDVNERIGGPPESDRSRTHELTGFVSFITPVAVIVVAGGWVL